MQLEHTLLRTEPSRIALIVLLVAMTSGCLRHNSGSSTPQPGTCTVVRRDGATTTDTTQASTTQASTTPTSATSASTATRTAPTSTQTTTTASAPAASQSYGLQGSNLWTSVQTIYDRSCRGCHAVDRPYDQYERAKADIDLIIAAVERDPSELLFMPQGASMLSTQERLTFFLWKASGFPDSTGSSPTTGTTAPTATAAGTSTATVPSSTGGDDVSDSTDSGRTDSGDADGDGNELEAGEGGELPAPEADVIGC